MNPSQAEPSREVPSISFKEPLKYEQAEIEEKEIPQENFNKKLFVFGILLFVFIISSSAIIFFLWFQIKPNEKKTDVIADIIQQEIPQQSSQPISESPKGSLNRQEISFEVLNGSGVAGSAKKAADKLEALGYKVIKTGNADKNNQQQSELLIAKSLQTKATLLLDDLKTAFNMASTSAELSDSTASARLIVGKE